MASSVLMGDMLVVEIGKKVVDGQWNCSLLSGVHAILHVETEWDQHLSKTSSATLKEFKVSWSQSEIHVYVDIKNGGCIMLHPSISKGPLQIVEFFGGLSGWSYAAHEFHVSPIAIIERDHQVASACAKAWDCPLISPETFFECALKGDLRKLVFVEACVSNSLVWTALGLLNVGFGFASPPCPPWSGAGSEKGLGCDDGQIFSTVLKLAGQFRMSALLVENVPGIARHSDFESLLAGAILDGMKMVVQGVFSVHRALPLYRDRWLATFCHVAVVIPTTSVQSVRNLSLASVELGLPLPGPSLQAFDAVHPNDASVNKSDLMPSNEALEFLRRSDMMPGWLKEKVNWTVEDPVLHARLVSPEGKLGGVMARYGSQHKLPLEHLKAKGLQTLLLNDRGQARLFSPWEILAALAFPASVVISKDLTVAFQQVGNAISPVHAWLQIAKTHEILGLLSPFPTGIPMSEVLKRILAKSINLSTVEQ
jgi:site-specific DNA-cytosine methylase